MANINNTVDLEYLKIAVDLAKQSLEQGVFPSGALIVYNDEIVSKHLATPFPQSNLHSDSKCIDEAMVKYNRQLEGFTLYSSMEPCLMCFSRAYWAGVTRIVYVVPKAELPSDLCYESDMDNLKVIQRFNRKFDIKHDSTFEKEVLDLFKKWRKIISY